MLIVFPLGLLATAVAFDIVGLVQSDASWFRISFWMIAAGIMGGLLAAVFGLIDWAAIPAGTCAKRIGLYHGATNVIVVLLFVASWFLRQPVKWQASALQPSPAVATWPCCRTETTVKASDRPVGVVDTEAVDCASSKGDVNAMVAVVRMDSIHSQGGLRLG